MPSVPCAASASRWRVPHGGFPDERPLCAGSRRACRGGGRRGDRRAVHRPDGRRCHDPALELRALKQASTWHGYWNRCARCRVRGATRLHGLFQPMLSYGLQRLASDARQPASAASSCRTARGRERALRAALDEHGLALIRMVTPVTTLARLEHLCRGPGFHLCRVDDRTTGRSIGDRQRVAGDARLPGPGARRCRLCLCVQVRHSRARPGGSAGAHVDGVVVGSAVIEAMEKGESTSVLLRRLRGDT